MESSLPLHPLPNLYGVSSSRLILMRSFDSAVDDRGGSKLTGIRQIKVAEEFGFEQNGGLTIPCKIETFKFLLNYMENNNQKDQSDESSCKLIPLSAIISY
ncbi:Indole-3-acetic acid-induced protein ARG7 [Senna tora]|uniref:Indole-3-acetic acid-induced protein ARG7 n=1 Tax=Senna tora TaxID=362788 RepID=A0A834SRH7_9FABA|nr:Indole-3-acetic acid-induced protein ARG7 [Senna tora]